MGRGRSKAGGGGGKTLKVAASHVEEMTTEQLTSEREKNRLAQENIKNAMTEISREVGIVGMGMPDEYYLAQKKLVEFQNREAVLNSEIAKRKAAEPVPVPKKTFVNSFGEATKREITTASYKRALKREEKAVRRNLGRD